MSGALDAIFVFPPPALTSLAWPYPAPHHLSTFANARGFRADVLDLNREAAHAYLDSPQFAARRGRARATIDRLGEHHGEHVGEHVGGRASLDEDQRSSYRRAVFDAMRGDYFASADGRQALLDGSRETDFEWLLAEVFLYQGRDLAAPTLAELRASLAAGVGADLLAIIGPLLQRAVVDPRPRLVGFSIPFSAQLLPALLIARALAEQLPDAHLCFGGPVVSLLDQRFVEGLLGFEFLDSVVINEGERVVCQMLERLRVDEREMAGIDNVVHRSPTGVELRRSPRSAALRLRKEDHFRYELPADQRESTVLSVLHSKGCYWGKCTFCDYINLSDDPRYRPRSSDDVADDLAYFRSRGFRQFDLITDALPPRHAAELGAALGERGIEDISIWCYAYIDARFTLEVLRTMTRSARWALTIGMESANDRLLDYIAKGYRRADIERFFATVRELDAGDRLQLVVNVIIDIPTTTLAEAEEVLAFCSRYTDVVSYFNVSYFTLTSSSEMGREPERFGLTILYDRSPTSDNDSASHQQVNTVAFTAAGGFGAEDRARLTRGYGQLNDEIRRRRQLGGWYGRILAGDVPASARVRFHPREAYEVHPLPASVGPGCLLWIRGQASAKQVSEGFAALYAALAGRELSLTELDAALAELVDDSVDALGVIQRCCHAGLVASVEGSVDTTIFLGRNEEPHPPA
ncbi:B12-binding domain-containing radical SAM protein [Enhygromyxa salina]|uniref:B12 binding domain protein n=1 Tax=Enhygromyxa salina TaxID=215803 RepID=A0A2S9XPM6_9BACT|nr:hypothetical protein [Enhygromyxa salina]PRP94819.1 B12 binding domain protein [Enhygromyxa salina]